MNSDVVCPGVLRLSANVLGLHVLTGPRAGTVGKGGGAGSQAEGDVRPAGKGSRDPHPELSCVTRNNSFNPDAI